MVSKTVEVEMKMKKAFCWSDLQIATWGMCQIRRKWNYRIQNRVDTIRENVAVENWYYVATKLNPADISARTTNLIEIKEKLL